ncbi:hypothetical protein ACIBI9_52660 [Nonomuraea sp. NPDC050451]|uniref:hypothetical protein n=1 Tax=Nonomuraea sp. NPDC050451 TaxID=3364364 RepID=UPI0037A8A608
MPVVGGGGLLAAGGAGQGGGHRGGAAGERGERGLPSGRRIMTRVAGGELSVRLVQLGGQRQEVLDAGGQAAAQPVQLVTRLPQATAGAVGGLAAVLSTVDGGGALPNRGR